MLVVVMSLPPVMKKRDRPLVGDSPARIRVPMVGTVSLGGVVAVANGRCGIPESSPGQAPSCIGHRSCPGRSRGEDLCDACGVGGRGMEARRGAGGGGSGPRAGCCLVERSAGASSRKKAAPQGPGRALKRPVCLTSRQSLLALRQRQASLRSGPRASIRQGPEPPEAALRDDLAGSPPHPQDRRDLKRPAVSGGHQGGGLSRALGCRPPRPGPRTAASPGPSTRRRPTAPGAAQPSLCPCRRGPPAPRPRPPPA